MCRFIHGGNGAILTNTLEIATIHCVSAGMLLKQTIIKDFYLISTPPSDGRVWQMSSFGVFEYHFQADVGDCVPNFDRWCDETGHFSSFTNPGMTYCIFKIYTYVHMYIYITYTCLYIYIGFSVVIYIYMRICTYVYICRFWSIPVNDVMKPESILVFTSHDQIRSQPLGLSTRTKRLSWLGAVKSYVIFQAISFSNRNRMILLYSISV